LMTWSAIGLQDRIAALRMPRGPKGSAPHNTNYHRGADPSGPRDETVREWLVRHHQTPRLIEMLWEPLAVAALNQSIDVASAAPFARVLEEMLGNNPRDASLAVPVKPLDETYALPARDYIEQHGGNVMTNSPARVACG